MLKKGGFRVKGLGFRASGVRARVSELSYRELAGGVGLHPCACKGVPVPGTVLAAPNQS